MSYNFQIQKSQLSDQYEKQLEDIKKKQEETQDKFKQTVNQPLDFLGGGLTEDSIVPLLKSSLSTGGKVIGKKIGLSDDTLKEFTDKIDNLKTSDLKNPKNALKKILKSSDVEGEEKQSIKEALTKTLKVVKDKPLDQLDKLRAVIGKKPPLNAGKASVSNIADSSIKGLDKDIQSAMGKNPSARDILSAKVRQDMRGTNRKTLNLDDDLVGSQRSQSKVKVLLGDDNPLKQQISLKQQIQNIQDTSKIDISSGRIKVVADKPIAKSLIDTDKTNDLKTVAKDSLKNIAKVDEEGGGPEDPIADVIGAVVGLGTFLGGIFGKHKQAHIANPTQISTGLNIGLDTV